MKKKLITAKDNITNNLIPTYKIQDLIKNYVFY